MGSVSLCYTPSAALQKSVDFANAEKRAMDLAAANFAAHGGAGQLSDARGAAPQAHAELKQLSKLKLQLEKSESHLKTALEDLSKLEEENSKIRREIGEVKKRAQEETKTSKKHQREVDKLQAFINSKDVQLLELKKEREAERMVFEKKVLEVHDQHRSELLNVRAHREAFVGRNFGEFDRFVMGRMWGYVKVMSHVNV